MNNLTEKKQKEYSARYTGHLVANWHNGIQSRCHKLTRNLSVVDEGHNDRLIVYLELGRKSDALGYKFHSAYQFTIDANGNLVDVEITKTVTL